MTLRDMERAVKRLSPIAFAMRQARADQKLAEEILHDALVSGAMANEVRIVILFNSWPRRHDGRELPSHLSPFWRNKLPHTKPSSGQSKERPQMNDLTMWAGSASTKSTQSTFADLEASPARKKAPNKAAGVVVSPKVVNAVYGYIQAVRALDRETVNTTDISQALKLSDREVQAAVVALKDKGVKVKR